MSRFFFPALPPTPSPPPVFWVLPLPLGKGLIGFASKDCIYSVLLGEARKHPDREDSGMTTHTRARAHTNPSPRGRCAHPPAPHPSPGPAGGGGHSRSLASLAWRILGDGAQDRMCFITVNNDPEYCLGLLYLGATGAARCRQPSRKRQRFI